LGVPLTGRALPSNLPEYREDFRSDPSGLDSLDRFPVINILSGGSGFEQGLLRFAAPQGSRGDFEPATVPPRLPSIVPTVAARTASDPAVEFLLHWLAVWDIENEVEFFRVGLEIACRFNFPPADPRIRKVLGYFVDHPLEWTLFEEPDA
jgi:hypothetical protein